MYSQSLVQGISYGYALDAFLDKMNGSTRRRTGNWLATVPPGGAAAHTFTQSGQPGMQAHQLLAFAEFLQLLHEVLLPEVPIDHRVL